MDHEQLIQEMPFLERLPTQERMSYARQRREEQLRNWLQNERIHDDVRVEPAKRGSKKSVKFLPGIMLLEASARNDIEEVRRLLECGVNPDSSNEDGLTALHQSCIDNNEEMTALLLNYGANVNAEDSERWTPLHAAATCAHLHLALHLIDRNANLLALNADGNMPYDICEDDATLAGIETAMSRQGITQELIDITRALPERRMLEDLQRLASEGGDLECRDAHGAAPLHVAAANGYFDVAAYLLEEHHVSTDVRDCDDWQPIHAAACWGQPDVLELLVENGADLDARTRNDETPRDLCDDSEVRTLVDRLRCEQETKRAQQQQQQQQQQQRRRSELRRRGSNRHRANSVKRVSFKDKQKTSRKEAKQEADLRLQFQKQAGLLATSAPATIDEDDPDSRDRRWMNASEPQATADPPSPPTAATAASPTAGRPRLSISSNGVSRAFLPPPSPTFFPKRFVGEASEVVGPLRRKFRCCVLV